MVSSVTIMTGRPSRTAKVTASSATESILVSVQPSAYWRMGELPMNVHASMGIPTAWEILATGSTSAIRVRAAQLGRMESFASTISRARAVTASTARGPAPGSPMSAVWMPRSSMRCRSRILSSMGGSTTEALCRPSRSVSSSSSTRRTFDQSKAPSDRLQS